MLTVGGVQVLPGLAETLPDLRRGRCPITSPLHPPQEETQPQHTPQLGFLHRLKRSQWLQPLDVYITVENPRLYLHVDPAVGK